MFGELVAVIGIIHGVRRRGAEIDDLMAGPAQPCGERGLQLDGRVIVAMAIFRAIDGYSHSIVPGGFDVMS